MARTDWSRLRLRHRQLPPLRAQLRHLPAAGQGRDLERSGLRHPDQAPLERAGDARRRQRRDADLDPQRVFDDERVEQRQLAPAAPARQLRRALRRLGKLRPQPAVRDPRRLRAALGALEQQHDLLHPGQRAEALRRVDRRDRGAAHLQRVRLDLGQGRVGHQLRRQQVRPDRRQPPDLRLHHRVATPRAPCSTPAAAPSTAST